MKTLSLHAISFASKIIQMRWDIKNNPHKYMSNTPGGVQASASQPPDPHWKLLLFFCTQTGCCVYLHPLGGAEHKTFFPDPCRSCLNYLRVFSFYLFY
jgi:hypothetical protein